MLLVLKCIFWACFWKIYNFEKIIEAYTLAKADVLLGGGGGRGGGGD